MPPKFFELSRILIVDDEPSNTSLLKHMLIDWGFTHIMSTTDPHQALPLCFDFRPQVVLLDLRMPGLDGFDVMKQICSYIEDQYQPGVIILTGDATQQTKLRALEAGAKDFLAKPFDALELNLRLRKLLELQFLHEQFRERNMVLEQRVTERTEQLASSERETAICLSLAGEYRDDETGLHTQRVATTAALIALHSDRTPEKLTDLIRLASPLHDVGKIGISDSILLKPGPLTPQEFERMQAHCVIGHSILSRHHTPLLQLAANIALCHHERWDGGGYPLGLKAEEIPLEGRIVAIADVFDALTHERPYKKAWPVDKAVAEIKAQAGRQFDPHLVDVFSQHWQQIIDAWADTELKREYLTVKSGRSNGKALLQPDDALSTRRMKGSFNDDSEYTQERIISAGGSAPLPDTGYRTTRSF